MASGAAKRRSFWSYGLESEQPTDQERVEFAKKISESSGVNVEPPPVPTLDSLQLREPRIRPPGALESFCTTDKHERAVHTYGRHGMELLRALHGDFPEPPDIVAFPGNEDELERVLAS